MKTLRQNLHAMTLKTLLALPFALGLTPIHARGVSPFPKQEPKGLIQVNAAELLKDSLDANWGRFDCKLEGVYEGVYALMGKTSVTIETIQARDLSEAALASLNTRAPRLEGPVVKINVGETVFRVEKVVCLEKQDFRDL